MWGDKKTEAPAKDSLPQQQPQQSPRPASAETAPGFPWDAKKMAPIDSTYPATSSSSSSDIARLGSTLRVKGELTGDEDLRIDGAVEGLIQLKGCKLTVGASAKVTANIIAREVMVYGNVKGNLRSRDRIEIKKDGSVVGDLTTARIRIEDGAYFKGSVEIDETGDAGDNNKPAYL
jgi:cytoskeletal protein CcmA (bactofilin family)